MRAALGFDLFIARYAHLQARYARTSASTNAAALCENFVLHHLRLWRTLADRRLFVAVAQGAVAKSAVGCFIGGMLVVLYIPIECWQIYYDVELIQLVQYASYNDFSAGNRKTVTS